MFKESPQPAKYFATRYVDNRFVIVDESTLSTLAFRTFALLDVYGDPIQLEKVDDDLFAWNGYLYVPTYSHLPATKVFLAGSTSQVCRYFSEP